MGGEPNNGSVAPQGPMLPRNWLQPFLLLSLEQWQSHGYELARRLAVFGFEAIDPGSVYRTLRGLEKDGLVSSDWDTSSAGPARRLYSLTDAGRDYLRLWAATLKGYRAMLDAFFRLYPLPATPTAVPNGGAPAPDPAQEGPA